MTRRIIFDLDGTLLNANYEEEAKYFYSCLGKENADYFVPNISLLLHGYEKNYDKYDTQKLISYLRKETSIDFTSSIIDGWRESFSQSKNEVITGVLETLDYLKAKEYSLVVLTNWFTLDQATRLKNANLGDYFDEVIGGDVALKPNLRSYMCATGRFSPSECVMVGDNPENDVRGAINAGLDAIYYDRRNDGKILTKRITDIRKLKEMY